MANLIKHVGILVPSRRKVVVAFRKIPSDPQNCIVITTENLNADEHDTLMKTVESNAGQTAKEFADVMSRTLLPDGRQMLQHFHNTGKLVKVSTKEVLLTPNSNSSLLLSELNDILDNANKENEVEVVEEIPMPDMPAIEEVVQPAVADNVKESFEEMLSDAARMRDYAESMKAEATSLRNQAKKLVEMAKKINEAADSMSDSKEEQ